MKFLKPYVKTMAASDTLTVPPDQRWKLKMVHVDNTADGHVRYTPYDSNTYMIVAANNKSAYWNGSAAVEVITRNTVVMDLWMRPGDNLIASAAGAKVYIEIFHDD